jgi:3-methyladenine DNA glycosylase AlkD
LPADFEIFESWISKILENWASCDTFCNHTIGEFIEMILNTYQSLKDLSKSNNRCVKRAAAVFL